MKWPWKTEKRSEKVMDEKSIEAALLQALIGTDKISKSQALQIPSVKASVKLLKDVVSSMEIKLYKRTEQGIEEVKDDPRVRLINDDTKGNMTGTQLKKAMVEDYLLERGAYVYIEKDGSKYKALHFVESQDVYVQHNTDLIFKTYDLLIQGETYMPYEFIKVIRDTSDGFTGKSLVEENSLILAVAYNSLAFENKLVKKGGNKKGFLTSERHLDKEAMDDLKAAWENLYSNEKDNVVVLNDGMDFKESSNTSVEMQLNENKLTNSEEITMLFTIGNAIIRGKATEQDVKNFTKFGVVPMLTDFESSINRDFLKESEKSSMYWAFDTKNINRGSMKDRFEAYGVAIDKNIMQVDEVREIEDLPPIGFNFVKLGLESVLYDPETQTIYTPNTNKVQKMTDLKISKGGEDENEDRDQE